MKDVIVRGFVLFFGVLVLTGTAHAGETGRFFAGLSYLNTHMEMDTGFTRDISGSVIEDARFSNPYTADAAGLFLGYTLPWNRCYLGAQAFFNTAGNAFELSAGSSLYTNQLNHSFGIDLMPGIYIFKGVSLFGKLGWIRGDFDFIKSSPTSTTYNVNKALDGYTLGLGAAWDVSPNLTLQIGYEKSYFEAQDIRASLSVMTDHTRIEPEADTFYTRLQYNF